jgi:hypothetical protein
MSSVAALWSLLVTLAMMNLCAAGIAAIVYAWSRRIGHGGRVAIGALVTGSIPVVAFLPIYAGDFLRTPDPEWRFAAMPVLLIILAVFSAPCAWLVSRKLDAPRDEFRAFE